MSFSRLSHDLNPLGSIVNEASSEDKEWSLVDIGISAEHFCLQATELGLGTCILGWFNENKIKDILRIPKKKSVGLVITLGYPPEDYPLRSKIRKSLSEITNYNEY